MPACGKHSANTRREKRGKENNLVKMPTWDTEASKPPLTFPLQSSQEKCLSLLTALEGKNGLKRQCPEAACTGHRGSSQARRPRSRIPPPPHTTPWKSNWTPSGLSSLIGKVNCLCKTCPSSNPMPSFHKAFGQLIKTILELCWSFWSWDRMFGSGPQRSHLILSKLNNT